ncbi:MAG: hypothetical protein GWN01_17360, partial [Nitrosopumilaceae archaeon]|nr:hypothetical protein [Nitrosopumilaceae archaeon]NIU89060.1 hypothetical protein [Nitrosopumilaceae archaeon]NIV67157.1 hypothetical protein [Nitrosopumilaceae archaeon]NIX63196.1 hypothetical protein [Nitrosopumilaceae archaeon]
SFYLEKDFARMQNLYESTNPADIAEAGKLREFFESLGTFDPKEDHMLFTKEQMYNSEGTLLIDPAVVERFKKYKDAA